MRSGSTARFGASVLWNATLVACLTFTLTATHESSWGQIVVLRGSNRVEVIPFPTPEPIVTRRLTATNSEPQNNKHTATFRQPEAVSPGEPAASWTSLTPPTWRPAIVTTSQEQAGISTTPTPATQSLEDVLSPPDEWFDVQPLPNTLRSQDWRPTLPVYSSGLPASDTNPGISPTPALAEEPRDTSASVQVAQVSAEPVDLRIDNTADAPEASMGISRHSREATADDREQRDPGKRGETWLLALTAALAGVSLGVSLVTLVIRKSDLGRNKTIQIELADLPNSLRSWVTAQDSHCDAGPDDSAILAETHTTAVADLGELPLPISALAPTFDEQCRLEAQREREQEESILTEILRDNLSLQRAPETVMG